MLVIGAGIHKMHARIANREDIDQTASSETEKVLVLEILEFGLYHEQILSIYRLVGDVLVSTAFLSYSGPFNQDFRGLLFKNWFKELKNRKIPFTLNLNTINMLVDLNVVCVKCHFLVIKQSGTPPTIFIRRPVH